MFTGQAALFYRFGVALFIGILVGLQREHAHDQADQPGMKIFAGVRTFALLGLAGCTAAYVADLLATPLVFVGLVGIMGLLIGLAYFISASQGKVGMTTEVAAILIFLIGALCYWDELILAVAIGVVVTALLSLKLELHAFAERISREDILAVLKFAIITAIILPLLPNESFGPPPFDVLNPYKIWLMVVLISGISFLGYILFKVLGTRRGISLTGLLGGLVSSTATTLSFSQRSQKADQLAKPFALAIIIAWTIMFGRVAVVVGAINRPLLGEVWLPLLVTGGVGLLFAGYLYLAPHEARDEEELTVANPFELRPAITFGLLYAIILLVARTAQMYLGDTGVYLSSAVSGLADVDAITVSMAQLNDAGDVGLSVASRAIILAVIANTLVKGGIVLGAGSKSLRKAVLPGFLLILAASGIMVFVS